MRKKTRVVEYKETRPFHPMPKKLGDALKRIRQEHNYTTMKLAKELNYSQSYISGMENGHSQPCLPYLMAFAKHFNLNEKQLLLLAGILPPQFLTYIVSYPEEAHQFLESRAAFYKIPEYPESMDYTRKEKS